MKIIHQIACGFVFASACSTAVLADNWPQFRGPDQNGTVPEKEGRALPQKWSEKENVRWKTPIVGRAWSSPVIWGKQVWMTNADKDGHMLSAICLDFETGKKLYDQLVFPVEKPYPLGNHVNSYGSPTPVIEEGRVYVSFGSYGTACIDTTTFKILWKRNDLPCRHFRGPASSPVLYKDLLIVTMDGIDVQYHAALDKKTGKTVWKTDRKTAFNDLLPNGEPQGGGDFRKAYSTPTFFERDGKSVFFSVGAKAAMLYTADEGKEIWRVRFNEFSAAARPVVDEKQIYFNSGYPKPWMMAIERGGSGDVTGSHIRWSITKSMPRRSSSIVHQGLLYQASDSGIVSCVRASNGEILWTGRLDAPVSASPILHKDLLYFCDENGVTHILKTGERYKPVTQNTLDAGFMASPAVSGNALILRSTTHVYRIEGP